MLLFLSKITFEEILPYWQKLWPDRSSPIEPISYMTLFGGYFEQGDYPATYLALKNHDTVVGVTSYHMTEQEGVCRHRGLWVEPEYRGQGLATKLLREALKDASNNGFRAMWAFPRQQSMKVHERAGFLRVSDWTMKGEYGPNAYAVRTF